MAFKMLLSQIPLGFCSSPMSMQRIYKQKRFKKTMLASNIKEDVLDCIFRTLVSIKEEDFSELATISNRTIHNSSIYQDHLSIDIAIVIYSLSKILREKPELAKQFVQLLTHAKELLENNQVDEYHQTIHEILQNIKTIDENIQKYRSHVITQAQIKKGTNLYNHGISVGQSASVMGISQWEMYNYIGKTAIHDDGSDSVENLSKRLHFTKALFDPRHKNTTIVFDAGPVITLALNSMLTLLPKIKYALDAKFLIPPAVKQELIDRPLLTKSHKLEAFHVQPLIEQNVLQLVSNELIQKKSDEICELANNTFYARGSPIKIIHPGESEATALALIMNAHAIVIEERTMRYLIETPSRVKQRMEYKMHTKITVNKERFDQLKKMFAGLRVIRTVELLTVAFEKGLFNEELAHITQIPKAKSQYFQGLIWGLKLSGCGVSEREVESLISQIG